MQAVTVALRRLDACALFDLNVAKQANPNSSVLPIGPHACMLIPTTTYSPAQNAIRVFVGTAENKLVRSTGAPINIAGAKAYERRDYGSRSKQCLVDLPVSFVRTIQFSYIGDDADPCPMVRQVANAAVARLQRPDAISVDPAKRPFAAWDGCFFLAQLLGSEAQNFTFTPEGFKDPFSGCRTTVKTQGRALPPGGLPTAPSAGPGGSSKPRRLNEPEIEIGYDEVPPAPKAARSIAGKTADVTTFPDGRCQLRWNQGDSRTGNQWLAALVITLSATPCDSTAQLAERAIALVDQQPSDAAAAPQRPLLLKPEDNDSPEPGACVDWGGDVGCEPYVPVSLPQGIAHILAAAKGNWNITCAVFLDTVQSVFGPSFHPVTFRESCYFVDSTHTVLLGCNANGEAPRNDYGRSDLYVDRQEIDIAGKPAISYWDKFRTQYDIYLSPFGDLSRDGNLHIKVEALVGRGDISRESAAGPPKLDQARAELGKQVITQVAQKYVSG